MGVRGPVPKRSEMRRRRNEGEGPITHALGSVDVEVPPADEGWHPVARRWYEALAESGQHVFYEPSDWATARLLAESISRDLKPQFVGISPDSGEAMHEVLPLKGASLSAYLRGMSALLVTEGDRRRARVELVRPGPEDGHEEGAVTHLDDYRNRAAAAEDDSAG